MQLAAYYNVISRQRGWRLTMQPDEWVAVGGRYALRPIVKPMMPMLSFRFYESPYPKVISREREVRAEQCGEKPQHTCGVSAERACVHGVYPAAHLSLRGGVGVFYG